MPVFNPIDFDGRVQRAAEALARDYEVTVLSVDSGKGFSHPAYRTEVVTLPDTGPKALRHLVFAARLLHLAVTLRPAVVHAHDFFMAMPGLLAARLAGARLVYDAHEVIVPDRAQPHTRRERLFYLEERYVARRADLMLSVTPEIANVLTKCYKLARPPLVIPNHSSLPAAIPSADEIMARWPLLRPPRPDLIRLVYAGDMDRRRGIADFITAMPHLDPRHQLVLIGDGPDATEIKAQAAQSPAADRILWLGKVPRTALFGIMRQSTIGVLTISGRILAFRFGSSNKVFEYTLAGLPLLATRQPSLARLIEAHRIGVLIPTRNENAAERTREIVDAVTAIVADLAGYRGRIPGFLQSHAWSIQETRLRTAYAEMLSAPGPVVI